MIHKNKIMIILLVCILLVNFIAEPRESEATAIAIGSSKLLSFLLALAATGVTVATVDQAEKLLEKYELDMGYNWDDMINRAPEPPSGGGPNPNKKLILATLIGGPVGAFLSTIFGGLKEWLQGLGAKEGENEISNDIYLDSSLGSVRLNNGESVNLYLKNKGYAKCQNINGYLHYYVSNGIDYKSGKVSQYLGWTNVRLGLYAGKLDLFYTFGSEYRVGANLPLLDYDTTDLETVKESIKYNILPNSYITTNIPPSTIPQPDISNLPLQPVIRPDGKEQLIYPGTLDDMVNDLVNNTTADQVQDLANGYLPYTLTETESGVLVEFDGQPVVAPFPEPDTSPIENPAEFQGKNIGLLQSIINWISQFMNQQQNIVTNLFKIPEGLSIDTSKLRLKDIQTKFPFSIPWDLYKAINVFAETPSEPNLEIDINTEYLDVNHTINMSTINLPLRFARYASTIFFIIFLAGKTRDLIKW